MNAGHELRVTRGFSASSEARQMMADWLRTTQIPTERMHDAQALAQAGDFRETLSKRYPCGLITDAEIEALVGVLQR
ncbi:MULTISPECIES: hypothetical protein [Pseudomonas]|jgi:hypothetical protein|uniref:Uncharacterized protein n=1 Tax=Pseudomonas lutea TaxID=243924 RepID=A0ABR9A854_9PSED|nr:MULTISPECIES: hypothetical protein [Pseudomonas]MBD8121564.1 hypothetical protein [Pseudomonas lutea]